MNLLLSGPPASGKSAAALEQFRSAGDAWLIVPSSTMAEHLRHELARSGYPVQPSRVATLAHFLESPAFQIPPPPSEPLLHMLIAEALDRLRPPRLAPLREFRGLHAALAALIEEIPPHAQLPSDLAGLFQDVLENLQARGLALRPARLRAAAAQIREAGAGVPVLVVFDGFFTLAPAELDLVEALAGRTSVTITLPEFSGAEAARSRLESAGFSLQRFAATHRAPERSGFSASTIERETEEIARRLLEYTAGGAHSFRDIAIVLRSRDPYAPALETTLARFGIPARSYFSAPLASHPAIAFLCGVVQSLLGGWDRAALASFLRMPVSGVGATPAGDRFDFQLRETMPSLGLPALSGSPPLLDSLAALDGWRQEQLPPAGWAERLHELPRLLPAPVIPESPADRDWVHVWRSTAAATRAFEEALAETATSLTLAEPIPLAQFWPHVETALALTPLRLEDRRRDVVHILDVFEARQWELPIVFVCGLLERTFPQYHREDPLVGDHLRARLGLSTASERQQEERFLFELAVTRATHHVILSYPRFHEKGEEALPSFFLEGMEIPPCDVRVRPAPSRPVEPAQPLPIRDAALLAQIAQSHRTLSASGIESFLQCPFQFFAQRTLRLRTLPPAPRDRLDIMVQGQIIHRALAEWIHLPLLGAEALHHAFQEACDAARIPATYRTEAVRLELLRHFEAFLAGPQLGLGWRTRVEEGFRFALNPQLALRGRIDRLDVSAKKQALVIDYKYSAAGKVRERVLDTESGALVQGGLYLLAAERALGLEPAGMLFCGLKKKVTWDGWHVGLPGLARIGQSRTRDALRELMDDAARRAIEVQESIASGRIAVQPADPDKCRWCDYRHACRVETLAAEIGAGAA